MGNIAERLLILAGNINLRPEESELCADAAEEIERLRSRVAELEAAFDAAKGVIARGTLEREALQRRVGELERRTFGDEV